MPPPAPPALPPLGPRPLSGELRLSFNGETTVSGRLDVENLANLALGLINGSSRTDAATTVKDALEELTVISDIGVWATAELNATASTVTLIFDIQFHYGPLVRHPLNLGSMPLIAVANQQLMNGIVSHQSTVTRRGQPPKLLLPEQLISLNATRALLTTLEGSLSFHFNGKQTTTTVPITASATQMRECLGTMDSIGEIEVFREEKMWVMLTSSAGLCASTRR